MTILPEQVRARCCDACPVKNGLQGKEYTEGFLGCHADVLEEIEPVAVCRGLAIANGWIERE
jgi:hypothetical protein